MKDLEQVVVAGAGLAGIRTVEELRARGYQGHVTLVGAEPHRPYDRPPLSKAFLAGKMDDTTLDSGALSNAALGVELRLGETAVGLGDGVLRTDRAELDFGALVLATGSMPVAVPGNGHLFGAGLQAGDAVERLCHFFPASHDPDQILHHIL